MGNVLKSRLEARRSGAKNFASSIMSNSKTLIQDVKERIDLDQNVPKSLTRDIPKGIIDRTMNLVSDTETRFAANNRKGLGR